MFPSDSRLLSCAEMAVADARAPELGVSGRALMERAGQAVADCVRSGWPEGPIDVLCGPGNNGGDGYVAARLLAEWGREVRVYSLAEPLTETDAADARTGWAGNVAALEEFVPGDGLILDALFGAGLSRPLSGVAARASEVCVGKEVLSVDVPSGLNADTGQPTGPTFHAQATVTFVRRKPGHLLLPGRQFCGNVLLTDIGMPEAALDGLGQSLAENDPALWGGALPWPSYEGHKHDRGRLSVVSGPRHATGAARLSALAGLRSGAGLVTLETLADALTINAGTNTSIMTRVYSDPVSLMEGTEKASVAIIGPAAGVDDITRANVLALLSGPARLVLDADALTVFADQPEELFRALRPDDVITPHAGEFARLFPDLSPMPEGKVMAARAASARAGCVVLLKGADTVIAHPGGAAVINANASPFLATAGSGDVLAGMIGGWMAQGLESYAAAAAAAWIHGECGRQLGPGMIADDIIVVLPHVLGGLYRAAMTDEA